MSAQGQTAAIRLRMLNYLQRLILILRLTCRNGLLHRFLRPRRNHYKPLSEAKNSLLIKMHKAFQLQLIITQKETINIRDF